MGRSRNNPALTVFAVITAISTLLLICVGGLVTSHGAGMAVPDWPTTYGYNMFLFPWSKWTGGIFYEHSHRLVASAVGFLTTILMVWLLLKEERRWLRWLGVAAFIAVVIQGVLGGLRVTLYKDELGIFHAALAQLFFVLVSAIAFFLSRQWSRMNDASRAPGAVDRRGIAFHPAFRPMVLCATVLILGQLILGATMRHQHAGLAVPDFPLAYGKLWPSPDAAFIEEINRARIGADFRDFRPITAAQIYLHMTHRLTAAAILALVGTCLVLSRKGEKHSRIARYSTGWFCLILVQAFLGAYTVWSNKAADVATAHVAVGALSLVWGSLLFIGTAPLAQSSACQSAVAHSRPISYDVASGLPAVKEAEA